jgi:hypothetical protein
MNNSDNVFKSDKLVLSITVSHVIVLLNEKLNELVNDFLFVSHHDNVHQHDDYLLV